MFPLGKLLVHACAYLLLLWGANAWGWTAPALSGQAGWQLNLSSFSCRVVPQTFRQQAGCFSAFLPPETAAQEALDGGVWLETGRAVKGVAETGRVAQGVEAQAVNSPEGQNQHQRHRQVPLGFYITQRKVSPWPQPWQLRLGPAKNNHSCYMPLLAAALNAFECVTCFVASCLGKNEMHQTVPTRTNLQHTFAGCTAVCQHFQALQHSDTPAGQETEFLLQPGKGLPRRTYCWQL